MKTQAKVVWAIIISISSLGCSQDDEIPQPGNGNPPPIESNLVSVGFEQNFSIMENEGSRDVFLYFDKPANSQGEIRLKLHPQDGLSFSSVPQQVDDLIILPVNKDDQSVSFQITPQNDDVIKGEKILSISISSLSEGFRKRDNNVFQLTVKDDELIGKLRSFGNSLIEKEFTYREDGEVYSVKIAYPGEYSWTEIYHYSEEGNIAKVEIPGSFNYVTVYIWEAGKLTRSEERYAGNLESFTNYDYDPAGNIGAKEVYHRDVSGDFVKSWVFIYLYFDDGNLFRQLTYIPKSGEEEYELISTRSYESYLDHPNLFPVNEVVPGISFHKNLPASYRVQENGFDLKYDFRYYFDDQDRLIKRETTGETFVYTYY